MRVHLLRVLPILGILAFIISVVYRELPGTYFQQDEWMTFTEYLYSSSRDGFIDFPLRVFRSTGHAHLIPLSLLRSYTQISLFKLQFEPYAILSIMHLLVNVFLLFFLALLLLRNRVLAFATALLFGLNSIGSQAVIWMASTINTQGAVTCLLLSFISFFYYVKNTQKKRFLLFSFLFIILGALFKETAFVGLISLPFFAFVWGIKRVHLMKRIVPFAVLVVTFYLLLRVPFVFLSENAFEKKPIKSWEEATVATYVYRGVTYPLKIISQSVVPYPLLSSVSSEVVLLGYPHQFVLSGREVNPYIRESIAFDLVSYIISFLILVFGMLLYRFLAKSDGHSNNHFQKVILFSLSFIAINALPYIFLPARPGYFSIYDPRALYMPSIGVAFLQVIFFYGIIRFVMKKEKYVQVLVLACAIVVSFFHAVDIWSSIRDLRIIGDARKSILLQTHELFPRLPKNVIFYAESDKEYYGQTEKILPFQSGFGQTLLIWYAFHGENFPGCFFEDNFLYPLEEKGKYKACNGRGFGYFRDYDRMLSTIKNEKFNADDIYAISWKSFEGKVSDITPSVREKIVSDLEKSK